MTKKTVIQFLAGCLIGGVGVAAAVCVYCCNADAPPPASPEPAQAKRAAEPEQVAPAATAKPAWLKTRDGVRGQPGVSKAIYDKYQSFDESFEASKEGGGEFVADGESSAYRINWLDPNSSLAKTGLKPGDRVISINGQAVGRDAQSGRALFDTLKSEKSFSVLIDRNGKREVLTYTVGE